MARLSFGCRHGGDPSDTVAMAVLLDISGLFLSSSSLTVHRGGGSPDMSPSVTFPCWRCAAGSDAELPSFAARWWREHRSSFGPDGLTPGPALWEKAGAGRVQLRHDPVSLLVAGLRLLDGAAQRDLHGRMREEDDPLYAKDLAPLPTVNLLGESLLQAADAALRDSSAFVLAAEPWPPGVPWALSLSHDIDHLRKWRRENRADRIRDVKRSLARRRGILRATRNVLSATVRGFGRPDPFRNVMEMGSRERERGLRATYFFGIADPSSSPYEITYTPAELREAVGLRDLRSLGHEIGLHGSYASAVSEHGLAVERKTLGAAAGVEIEGVRQHYLRFSWDKVFPRQVQAGFGYDSSWGYPQTPGFRGGLGTPFLFETVERPGTRRVELPMAVMDGATLRDLFEMNPGGAARLLDPLVHAAAATRGLLVVNWHNTAFERQMPRPYVETFDWIVEAAKRRGARTMTLGEVARWWGLRSQVKAEVTSGRIQVKLPEGLDSMGLRILGKPPAGRPEGTSEVTDSAQRRIWTVQNTARPPDLVAS